MTIDSQQYANLADHTYDRDGEMRSLVNKQVEIDGAQYKVLDHVDNPRTGYQGTIYQRVDGGDIVVAHRGTEPGREFVQDVLRADAGMVVGRSNIQAQDAIELTRRALELAKSEGETKGVTPEVSVTGHSLGGTLAQISAHHFDLPGETFNAYGAASLDRRIPEGPNGRVVNHVMAADPVSAASPHYGEVRIYANQREIDTLNATGYHNNRLVDLVTPDNPLVAAGASFGSHSQHQFLNVDGDGRPDRSVLGDPAARQLAEDNKRAIEGYRDDVEGLRRGVTVISRGPLGLVRDGIDHVRGPVPAGEPAAREERERQSQNAPAPDARRSSVQDASPRAAVEDDQSQSVARLFAAARAGDAAALRGATAQLEASEQGQAWQERADTEKQALAAREQTQEQDARRQANDARVA